MVQAQRRTQSQRSEQTRARLLDATIESLIDVGYAATTTMEVARRADLSRGAQLHHFPTRSELVVAAIGHLLDRRTAELVAQVDSMPVDPEAWLDTAIDLVWASFHGPLFYAALELWVAARTDQELAAHLKTAERRIGGRIRELLASTLPAAVTSNPHALEHVDSAILVMRGLALRRLLTDDPSLEQRMIAMLKAQARRLLDGSEASTHPDKGPSVPAPMETPA